jgi:hypothetical protein
VPVYLPENPARGTNITDESSPDFFRSSTTMLNEFNDYCVIVFRHFAFLR